MLFGRISFSSGRPIHSPEIAATNAFQASDFLMDCGRACENGPRSEEYRARPTLVRAGIRFSEYLIPREEIVPATFANRKGRSVVTRTIIIFIPLRHTDLRQRMSQTPVHPVMSRNFARECVQQIPLWKTIQKISKPFRFNGVLTGRRTLRCLASSPGNVQALVATNG